MSNFTLKNWQLDRGVYISPRFGDIGTFNRYKTFFIRAGIFADCDEGNRIIKIPVSHHSSAYKNKESLEKLNLI